MEREQLKDIIVDNLKKYSLDTVNLKKYNLEGLEDFESLSNTTKEQYLALEEYFQKCVSEYERAIEIFDSIKLNVRDIAELSDVAKSTIYKNKYLQAYVENRVKDIELILFNKNELESLKERYKLAEDTFLRTKINIVKLMNVETENDALKKRNKGVEARETAHILNADELARQIDRLEQKILDLQSDKTTVISLDSKKTKKSKKATDE